MALFHYPKGRYKRRFTPRAYKAYRSFKRVLQHEFSRLCVYCREPDSAVPLLYYAYSVDHYRPQSDPRFTQLRVAYSNLYYCCSECNSRKKDYWPQNETVGPIIVNPCDHDMSEHLRFNSATSEVDHRSVHGSYMVKLFQLNHPEAVEHRRQVRVVVDSLMLNLARVDAKLKLAAKKLKSGRITAADFAQVEALAVSSMTEIRKAIDAQTGAAPPPPLKARSMMAAPEGKSAPTPATL